MFLGKRRRIGSMMGSGIAWCLITILVGLATVAAADDSAGKAAYKTKCIICHGPDGSGDTPVGKSLKVANLRSPEVQKKSDAELIQVIGDGKGNMPSFRSSTKDDELQALVKYIRELGKAK